MNSFCQKASVLHRVVTAWFFIKLKLFESSLSWTKRLLVALAYLSFLGLAPWAFTQQVLAETAIADDTTHAKIANYPIKHYTIEQGLSQSVVYDVVQDQLGYIWVATGRGLNRFDGHDFKVFLKDAEFEEALQHDYIHRLLVDHKGDLWVGTLGGGLAKYNAKSERLTRFVLDAKAPNIEIYDLVEDASNNIWVVTEKTLYRISADRRLIQNYQQQLDDLKGALRTVAVGPNKQLFLGTDLGEVYVLATPEGANSDLARIVDDSTLGLINHISPIEGGRLLIASSTQGLFEVVAYRYSSNQWQGADQVPNQKLNKLAAIESISNVLLDSEDNIWISTDGNGLFLYRLNTGVLVNLKSNKGGADSLNSDRLLTLYRDRSDNLWVGTFASGLNSMSLSSTAFQRITDNVDQKIHLSNRVVWAVHVDQHGGVWVGTDTGVDYRAPQNQHFEKAQIRDTSNRNLILSGATSFIEDDNILWIGTWAQGLVKFNTSTQLAEQFNSKSPLPGRLNSDRIRVLLNTSEGKLWIGTRHGLSVLDKTSGNVVFYQNDADNSQSLPHNRIRSLYQDDTGRIWVGTSAGLVFYDQEIDGFRRPQIAKKWGSEIREMDVRAIYKDENNIFWLGTGNGLLKADFSTGDAKIFQQDNGLPNNVLYSFLPDSYGNYWIATDNGLSMFDSNKEEFTNYFVQDGLQGNELNFGAQARDLDGNLYFGGTEGLTIFNEANLIPKNLTPAPLVINDISSYSASYNLRKHYTGGFKAAQPFMFDIEDKRLEISFVGLDYRNPHRLKYAYQLGNQDHDWNRVDANNRLAVYTNLRPGAHEFKVGYASSTSSEVTGVESFTIYMEPATWQTTWFKLLMVLIILAAILLIVNHRVRALRARAELLKAEVEVKTQALKSSYEARSKDLMIISHNLGTPIAVINQMAGIVKRRLQELGVFDSDINDQLDLLKQGISEADERVSQLSDVVRLQRWELKKNQRLEIKEKLLSTLPAFEKNSARIEIGEIPEATVFCPSDAPSLILDNLISNALKYSPEKSQISLRFIKTKTHYCIECSDLGAGIPTQDRELVKTFEFRHKLHEVQATGQGIGLSLVNGMLEACGGLFEITDNAPCGSVMSAFIPLADE
jgi:ligand-binding sensor domain-containing protein/signal transduction histidine kinase